VIEKSDNEFCVVVVEMVTTLHIMVTVLKEVVEEGDDHIDVWTFITSDVFKCSQETYDFVLILYNFTIIIFFSFSFAILLCTVMWNWRVVIVKHLAIKCETV